MIIFDLFEDANKKPHDLIEGVDLINMTDLQFYKELLAVLLIPVTALGVSAWNKVMNSLRLYRAEEIVQALSRKGITVDRDTFDQIKPLLQQLEQAIDVNNDGDAAKELAQRIQQTVSWGKLKQPTANSQSPATARDQQGISENQYEIHHLDPEGRRKAIYHHGKGYTDDVIRKDTQYHQKQNPRDTFRVFKDKQPFDWQDMAEGVGDKRTDPAPSKEFVSNKFYVKFTPTGIEFYRRGELVHTRSGDYSNPTRGDYGLAKGITARLWEKEYQQGVDEGAPISGDGGAVDNFKQQMANSTEVAYQTNLKNAGVAESLKDYERYQYIVTLKSGKRIRFLCGADCDVKTYIERKYKEPVVDIKDQGIVGEPPVELLPGEMKRDGLNEFAPKQKQPSDQEGKISAELRKLRAQYPDARSDLEAVAIGGQEAHDDARKHLARVDDIVSKLDRAADQLQSVNVDQDSELNTLDRENNDLEKQVKDLEQRIDQLKQPRSKAADQPTQARSTEPRDEPAAKADSTTKADPAKAKNKPKTDLDTDAPLTPEYRAKLATQLAQRNNQKYATTPKDLDMIQKILAKDKAPYQPSAQDVARAAEKTKTQADLFRQYNDMAQGEPVTEVSPEYIERYKKEHGRRATAADQAGDYAKGHEHFKKINKLTKQQFQRGAKPEKVDEISNFMTLAPKPVAPEEQWKRQIRLLAKQYQANASSLAALAREKGPDSAEAVAYEYLRDPSKIRIPGTAAPSSAVNWDDVIRRLPMGLSGMALLQAAEEYLTNTKGMLRSTVRNLLNNDENQRSLSAAYAKKNVPTESVTEDSDYEAVEQAIIRRIMVGRTDLLLKYGPRKVMQAVEDIADYVGAVDEIGSSDVSGWVSQVEQSLSGMAEAANPAQQAAIAINMKRHHTKPKKK